MFRLLGCCTLAALAAAGFIIASRTPTHAQSYPARPVTIIVPLAAGTGMDTLARLYSEQLAQALGKPVVIENSPTDTHSASRPPRLWRSTRCSTRR